LREVYEIGIVFRGFVIVQTKFKELPKQSDTDKDLRGAFISAITTFAENFFANTSLEYLESGDFLFVFKIEKIQASDSPKEEPIIMYGLIEKKKKPDKIVKKFLEKVNPIFQLFIHKYNNEDFTELTQFEPFEQEIRSFFEK